MKKILILLALMFSAFSFGQKVSYTGIILVDSVPEELLPVGVAELGFILAGDNNQPVGFGYEISELNYKIISKFGKEFDGYTGVEPKAYFKNDTLFFWSHVKYKDVQTYNYYSWDSKKLTLMESVTTDASAEAARDGEAALRKKQIREAAEIYNRVKYVPASTEAKTAMNLLGVAHYLAKDAFKAESYKEAVEYMDGAFVYHLNKSIIDAPDEFAFNKIVMANFEPKQIDSIGPWLADYAMYLHKADSFERSIKISAFVIMCYPKMPNGYLTMADALYDSKKEDDAKPMYDKYMAMMSAKGRDSEIVERAKERFK